jgi:predicted nucleotidyltransferase
MSDLKLQVKKIGLKILGGTEYKLGLFGSRVVGKPAKYSDLDVAVMGQTKIPGHILENLREAFENSDLPYRVDVVDLNRSSAQFKSQVLKEVVWL